MARSLTHIDLINSAIKAKEKAYCPYSKFRVGAAILTSDKIFTGSNIENSSYGLTICAERVAIFKAVSEGYKDFKEIAISSDTERFIYPCGACRQVLSEFVDDIKITLINKDGKEKIVYLKEIFKETFILKKKIIGITGKAGSGKTTISELLRENGFEVISADEIGWEILKNDEIKEKIKKIFGEGVFKGSEISRDLLRDIVFKNPEKLDSLNNIVHPLLLKELRKRIDSSESEIIFVDAALISYWGIEDWFDKIILVKSNKNVKRLKEKGIKEDIIKGILKAQDDVEKLKIKDVIIIRNDSGLDNLKKTIEKILKYI